MATIKDDILALEQKQLELKIEKKRYIQMRPTPACIPMINVPDIQAWADKKGLKPQDETEYVDFDPTQKDYQFMVMVWTRKTSTANEESGFNVIARRNLGGGVIETVTLVDAKEAL